MKKLNLLIIVMIFISLSCTQKTVLSEEDKQLVESEINQFMDSLVDAFNSASAERVYNYMLQTDELTIATQGTILANPYAVLDTMKVHLSGMLKQESKPVRDKIFVINKDAAVISTAKIVTITFKNDSQVTMPYALTMLLVKREGKWKIAHYHN